VRADPFELRAVRRVPRNCVGLQRSRAQLWTWTPEARAHLVRRHLSELNSRMALSSQAMVKWRGELQPSQALKKRSRQRR
jgi:hypothetical protein